MRTRFALALLCLALVATACGPRRYPYKRTELVQHTAP